MKITQQKSRKCIEEKKFLCDETLNTQCIRALIESSGAEYWVI